MRYRTFGDTDIQASEVGFGCWTLSTGWWGKADDAEAVRLLRRAFDLGITFFDTADTYGNGRSERQLAAAFDGLREQVVIATKFGYDWERYAGERKGQQEIPQDWSPAYARKACEASLRRLGTDYVDLYQLHNARMDAIERDDLFATLEDLKAEGKIRGYAVALGPALGWRAEGLAALERRDLAGLHTIYNLLEQDPGRDFFPPARQRGSGILVRVPHSSGMLEGKYTEETTFPPEDHRSHRPRSWLLEGLRKIGQLRFLHEGCDWTLGQAALKFILAEPAVTTTLPNIYNEEQLAEFAAAPGKPDLTGDELARIAHLYAHGFYLEEAGAAG